MTQDAFNAVVGGAHWDAYQKALEQQIPADEAFRIAEQTAWALRNEAQAAELSEHAQLLALAQMGASAKAHVEPPTGSAVTG